MTMSLFFDADLHKTLTKQLDEAQWDAFVADQNELPEDEIAKHDAKIERLKNSIKKLELYK